MSTTVDSKVVEMKFDNKNFESNVATTMTTLGRLKQSLNLSGASKGLDDVASSADKINGPMSGLAGAVETVRSKFSALEVMGVTALANITNSAVNAGMKIVSALTIEPIKMGFQEYETQMNAVQTIMANTSSKGTTIDDVNAALDELNTYADKTIYNFTEMTRNIGTFTAAGVDLDTSVSAIQGIANLAAVSGSTSQQASTAMYQLSQALASGTVKLQDWNSVVNAGMGGEVFQNALKRTAENMGVNVDAIIERTGSFRESLKDGWLTTDILTETLKQFTMAAEEGSAEWNEYKRALMEQGYTEQQATDILKMANTATDAATKVKTLTQLWDTLKEAAQSGWTQSWEIIVGDFEEAKELFTEISDVLNGIIAGSAQSRNEVLQGWKDMGGRAALIDSLKNAFEGIMSIVKPISEAFREVFPPITAETLYNLTTNLKEFTEKLKLSGETSDKVKRIFKGLFSIIDIVRKVITTVVKALFGLSQSEGIGSLGDFILNAAASIGDFFTTINENFSASGLFSLFSKVGSGISSMLKSVTGGLSGLGNLLSSIGQWIVRVANKIWEPIQKVFTWIEENVSMSDILAGLTGGGIVVTATKFTSLIDMIKGAIDKLFGDGEGGGALQELKKSFTDVLDSVKESLQAFTTGIKVWSLVGIAAAVGILAHSLRTLSGLSAVDIGKSLVAVGIALSMLTLGFKSMVKSLDKFKSKGIVKSAFALILVAKAVDILADAIVKLADLSLKEIAKGLLGVGGGILMLCASLKTIGNNKVSLSTSIAMLALSVSCGILADALKKFSDMSWSEIARGLTAMGGALAELTASLTVLSKVGGKGMISSSIAILIAVQGLDDLAEALKSFGEMSWGEIRRGLSAMGGALAEVGVVLGALGKIAGFSSIFAAGAIWIVVQGLGDLADTFKKFGTMSWGMIRRGLTAMGGALGEVGLITGALGKLAGFSGVLGSAAIWITIQGLSDLTDAFERLGGMSWGEIGRGLSAMGGALLEIGVIAGVLGYLANFAGLLGAATIWITIQGLGELADAFEKLGKMTWSEIGRGLSAMGGALLEIGVIAGVLGYLANFAGLLGAATIWVAVQGLGDLADAFQKFGEMSWSEVETGLAAMGGALSELAVGGLANTLSIIGALSISEMAKPLGDLADSVKKWSDVKVPKDLKANMAMIAAAIWEFTFSGMGASAMADIAKPLGDLADSVRKWQDITIPKNFNSGLSQIAEGVKCFTWLWQAGWSLDALAEPLGELADGVKKWENVTVPAGLEEVLTSIADGVRGFSWLFLAGWSIDAIAEPLGELADNIKKWADVSIPVSTPAALSYLAEGIEAFSWLFLAGWSIDALAEPLGELADALKKWSNVTLPAGMGPILTSLAEGVHSFDWAFTGAWTISSLVGPLNGLADAVNKWSTVSVPADIKDKLTYISDGVKEFGTAFFGSWSIDSLIGPLGALANSVNKWSEVSIPAGIDTGLQEISDGIGSFNVFDIATIELVDSSLKAIGTAFEKFASIGNIDSDRLEDFAEGIVDAVDELTDLDEDTVDEVKSYIRGLANAFKTIAETDISGVKPFIKAVNSLNEICVKPLRIDNGSLNMIKQDVISTMSAISNQIRSGQTSITNSTDIALNGMLNAINAKKPTIKSAAESLINNLRTTISSKQHLVSDSFKTVTSGAATAIKGQYRAFRSAGAHLVSVFAAGISENTYIATAKARAMAAAAAQAARDELDINSPSRVFREIGAGIPEGFAQGISEFGRRIDGATRDMAGTAVDGARQAISNVSDIVDMDINVQPTIRPVVDLSNVRAGASAISGMFSTDPSMGLLTNIGSISSNMNRRAQRNTNDDIISAITDLKKVLGNRSGDTYQFGDIMYGDDSNISGAVQDLIRAIRMERRT